MVVAQLFSSVNLQRKGDILTKEGPKLKIPNQAVAASLENN
jgi:hypothetical protein